MMMHIKKILLPLPGVHPLPTKKAHLFSDMVFFILMVALPSSFFALVPQHFFYKPGSYDLNLFFFFAGLFYFIFYFKSLPKIWNLPSGKYFICLCFYLWLQFLYSWLYMEIPLREVITIFRKNFFWPIATLGFLLYAASMNSYRIERFFRWLLSITFVMTLLYIFSNATSIDVFGARVNDTVEFEGQVLMQNVYAIPRYLHILFVFAFIASFTDPKFKNYWMWMSAFLLTVLSFVRSQLAVYLLYMFFVYSISKIGKIPTNLKKSLKQISSLFIIAIIIFVIFPHHLDRLIYKFGFSNPEISTVEYQVNVGTFDFRIWLIQDAYNRTKDDDNLILGNGYIREASAGSYDFVLGGDTYIAPVIYTEGILGIVMRWLPLLVLLFYGLHQLFKRRQSEHKLYWLAIVVLILPQFLNVVQTTIFIEYNHWYFIIALLMLLINNIEKRKVLFNGH